MAIFLEKVTTKNFRALADVEVELRDINVLFGPNGAGKSTFLDVLWFVRDCASRGVDEASAFRSHGIGMRYDGAADDDPIAVGVETREARYELSLGLSSGRIEPFPGEKLHSKKSDVEFIKRQAGSDKASFFHTKLNRVDVPLREPNKLSLGRFLDLEEKARFNEAADLDRRLHFMSLFTARSLDLGFIKRQGSERSHERWLKDGGRNLWSVLENLRGKSAVDDSYDTILRFMRRAFPSFRDLTIDPTSPATVYGSFLESGRRAPILASGMSDGHVHMLLMLTALFSEGRERTSILLFDEPEQSLHPWALAVLGEAIREAARNHQKQIIVATHSPVLMSQFEPDELLAAELVDGRTQLTRLSEKEGIDDLLEQYAAGSLYMSELVAPQSRENGNGDA